MLVARETNFCQCLCARIGKRCARLLAKTIRCPLYLTEFDDVLDAKKGTFTFKMKS